MKTSHLVTALALCFFGCNENTLTPDLASTNDATAATSVAQDESPIPVATYGSDPGSAETSKRIDGSSHGGRPLYAELSGASEVPPADPDGSGTALVTLNQGQGEVCFELEVADISPATASHIHAAPAGANGGVVVALSPPTTGTSSGCVTGVDKELIKDIRQNPENYYVNVHNADYPGGAVRGQLHK